MANVGHTDYQRGQIMIVMSLVLAVMLVAMALYLNTAIFTENLATRKGDIAGAGGAISYQYAVVEGASGALAYANYNSNSTYDNLEDAIETDLENWSQATNQLESTRSRSVEVSVSNPSRGTRIVQDNDRNFTNVSGNPDWYVVQDAGGVRNFHIDLIFDDLSEVLVDGINLPTEDETPKIRFTDGIEEWQVELYQNDGNAYLAVTDLSTGTMYGPCQVVDPDIRVEIDVTGAEFGGDPCPALEFFDTFDGDIDIEYVDMLDNDNPTIVGQYELLVEKPDWDIDFDNYDFDGSEEHPYPTVALYSIDIDITYQTARIDYRTVVRIAPGEPE